MQRSVEIIAGAVETLADSDQRYRRDMSQDGDFKELKAVKTCLSQIRQGHEALGWTEAQAGQLDPVIEQVDRLLGGQRYTRQDRLRLLRTAAQPLIPLMLWPDSLADPNDPNQPALSDSMIVLQTLYTEHRPFFVRAARSLIKDLLSRHTSFLLGRTVNVIHVFTDVPDPMIFVEPVEPAQYRLSFLSLTLAIGVHINSPARVGIQVSYSLAPSEFTGTRDELTDYCLLLCRRQVRRTQDRMWLGVLRHVTGATEETTYEQALRSRLAEGGWPDERAWILDCARSENHVLRYLALAILPRVVGREAEPMLLRILADPNAESTDRQAAVSSLSADSSTEALIAVAEVLSDQTPIRHREQKNYDILTRPGTPFEGYPLLPLMVKSLKVWIEENGQTPRTMADLARERLGLATKHRFDKDAIAAQQWIEANWPR